MTLKIIMLNPMVIPFLQIADNAILCMCHTVISFMTYKTKLLTFKGIEIFNYSR
ncbi:MAG: hypothetical protein A4E54_01643 [Pelotomaculum sp. PtaB.Bin117]|nr:MAG: hypothetical protein A4E54_01643 [Pelotomaculum sp. PtaB.Bin117]